MLNLGTTAQGVQKIYIVGNHNNLEFINESLNARISKKKRQQQRVRDCSAMTGAAQKVRKKLKIFFNNLSTQVSIDKR